MRKLMTFGIPLVLVLVAVLVMVLMIRSREAPSRRSSSPRIVSVKVAVAEPSRLVSEIRAYGTLQSTREIEMVSEVGGTVQAGDVPFLPGQSFRSGQVLVRVDDRSIRYRLAQLRSQLMNSLATLLPELELDFPERVGAWRGYFARIEIDAPLAELPSVEDEKLKLYLARYNIYQSFYDIRSQELLLSKAVIRAPFDGVIAETATRVGAAVMTGGRLGRILSLEDLEIEVALPAGELAWLDPDRPVTLIVSGGGSWQGRITRRGGEIAAATQTLPVYVSLPAAADLPPVGSFVEVRFVTLPLDGALRLPRAALYRENEVYVIEEGRLALRSVTLGRLEADEVLIVGGVAVGDSLVAEALDGVIPGMLVRPRSGSGGGKR